VFLATKLGQFIAASARHADLTMDQMMVTQLKGTFSGSLRG
jgi:hypothetical protein